MRKFLPLFLGMALLPLSAFASATPVRGALNPGHDRNLFAELLGKSDAEVSAKIGAGGFHPLALLPVSRNFKIYAA